MLAMQACYKTFMCLCNKYVGMHEVWHGMQNGAMTIGRNIFRSLTEQEWNSSQRWTLVTLGVTQWRALAAWPPQPSQVKLGN